MKKKKCKKCKKYEDDEDDDKFYPNYCCLCDKPKCRKHIRKFVTICRHIKYSGAGYGKNNVSYNLLCNECSPNNCSNCDKEFEKKSLMFEECSNYTIVCKNCFVDFISECDYCKNEIKKYKININKL